MPSPTPMEPVNPAPTARYRALTGISTPLRPYQKRAVKKARFKKSFGLFMAPGTGKTLTALSIIANHYNAGRVSSVLIIGPKIAERVWREQVNQHLIGPVEFLDWHDSDDMVWGELTFKFCNPEKIWRKPDPGHYDAIIVDESQCIKNRESKQSQFIQQLKAPFKYILTGTPIDRDPIDLWSQWAFAKPEMFGTYKQFVRDGWVIQKPILKNGQPIPFVTKDEIFKHRVKEFIEYQKPNTFSIQKTGIAAGYGNHLPGGITPGYDAGIPGIKKKFNHRIRNLDNHR